MTDELIAGIALIVGCFVAIPTYRWARHKKSKKRKFIEKAQKTGHCVVGEFADSKVISGIAGSSSPRYRDDSLRVKYRYVVNGITYYKSMTFQSRGRIGTDYPIRVNVYYDPRNPKKAYCLEEAHSRQQIQTGCYTTIVATLLSMFVVFHIIRILIG